MSESEHAFALRQLRELSELGAASAANALGQILGRDVVARAGRQVESALYRSSVQWDAGVIFEAEGFLSGLVAVFLPAPSRPAGGALVVGDPTDGSIESPLCELGNIVASHTVSAMADELGESILLSVPTLVMDGAADCLVTRIGERQAAYCFESDLFASNGERVAAIVFVPDFVEAEQST